VDDDVTSICCQSAELTGEVGVAVELSGTAASSQSFSVFQMTVRGLCRLGRLLMAFVNSVLRLCTSSSGDVRAADASTTTSFASTTQLTTYSDVAN